MTRKKIFTVAVIAVVGAVGGLMVFQLLLGDDFDNSRSRAATLLMTLLSERPAIEEYVRSHRTLTGAGGIVTAKGDPKYRQGANQILVSDDATMIAVNTEKRVMIVLLPRVVEGIVSWRCVTIPETAAPMPCKDDGKWLNRQ